MVMQNFGRVNTVHYVDVKMVNGLPKLLTKGTRRNGYSSQESTLDTSRTYSYKEERGQLKMEFNNRSRED